MGLSSWQPCHLCAQHQQAFHGLLVALSLEYTYDDEETRRSWPGVFISAAAMV